VKSILVVISRYTMHLLLLLHARKARRDFLPSCPSRPRRLQPISRFHHTLLGGSTDHLVFLSVYYSNLAKASRDTLGVSQRLKALLVHREHAVKPHQILSLVFNNGRLFSNTSYHDGDDQDTIHLAYQRVLCLYASGSASLLTRQHTRF